MTPGYQAAIISILPEEDISGIFLLLKDKALKEQFSILRNKIEELHEEAHTLSVRFNSTPVSQTAMLTLPNSTVSNKLAKPDIFTPADDHYTQCDRYIPLIGNRFLQDP